MGSEMCIRDRMCLCASMALARVDGTPQAARIMCLGDSITLGVGGGGYRQPLAGLLQKHTPDWDFVGPMYANGGKHAGYNGWTIAQILTVAQRDLLVHQPTHVLLMAGTNDFFFLGDPKSPYGANASKGVERMTQLLALISDNVPNATVIFSGCLLYTSPSPRDS